MFESLQEGLLRAVKTLAGRGKLTQANMQEGLQLVEDVLLEADVNYKVAKDFLRKVSEQALGQQVLTSLRPTEQLLTIIRRELVGLMGPVDPSLHIRGDVTVLMMCGLQGSGKTTTCGKLAKLIRAGSPEVKPLLVAADLQRPGAVDQLRILGEQVGVPVYYETGNTDPVAVCQNGVKHAKANGCRVVILDTAGRLAIDDELMAELARIDRKIEPQQVYLVVDGATGQDAVESARRFNEKLELDGVIMTKLDGDARGGATLSVKSITGVPIKFIGVGEHLDDLQPFDPDRMATRILGGGDVLELINKAQSAVDEHEQKEMQKKMAGGQFTLADFRKNIDWVSKMGSMGKIMDLLPGMGQLKQAFAGTGVDADKEMKRFKGIIDAMTVAERNNPRLIDHSRRRRIAAGAGVEPQEVNALVKQFDAMAGLMTNMSKLSMLDRFKTLNQLGNMGALGPGGPQISTKQSTGKRLTPEEKKRAAKQREKDLRKLRRKGKQ